MNSNTTVIQTLSPDIADKNFYPNFWEYNSDSILIETTGVPETWEILGNVYKEIDIDARENYQDWVIAESRIIYPHGKQLITWDSIEAPYRLKFRFVRYLRSGEIVVTEVNRRSLIPPEPETGWLDDFPNGSIFAVDNAYSSFNGDAVEFINNDVIAVNDQSGSGIKLLPVDVVNFSGGAIYGSDNAYIISENAVNVEAPLVLALRVRLANILSGQTQQLIDVSSNTEIRLLSNDTIRGRIRNNANYYQLAGGPAVYDSWINVFLVGDDNNISLYLNNSLLAVENRNTPFRASGAQLRIYLKGIEFKFGALWQSPAPLPDVTALNAALNSHYQ